MKKRMILILAVFAGLVAYLAAGAQQEIVFNCKASDSANGVWFYWNGNTKDNQGDVVNNGGVYSIANGGQETDIYSNECTNLNDNAKNDWELGINLSDIMHTWSCTDPKPSELLSSIKGILYVQTVGNPNELILVHLGEGGVNDGSARIKNWWVASEYNGLKNYGPDPSHNLQSAMGLSLVNSSNSHTNDLWLKSAETNHP